MSQLSSFLVRGSKSRTRVPGKTSYLFNADHISENERFGWREEKPILRTILRGYFWFWLWRFHNKPRYISNFSSLLGLQRRSLIVQHAKRCAFIPLFWQWRNLLNEIEHIDIERSILNEQFTSYGSQICRKAKSAEPIAAILAAWTLRPRLTSFTCLPIC